jgi:hypothetical protein
MPGGVDKVGWKASVDDVGDGGQARRKDGRALYAFVILSAVL